MEQRVYHGSNSPDVIANALYSQFNRGNFRVQKVGDSGQVVVQIATSPLTQSGGQTALSVNIQKVQDGVLVQVGQQTWIGIAASLGISAIQALRNPLSLLGRLDDIAQDYESITLSEEIWRTIDGVARANKANFELSERLRRVACSYCGTANPIGEAACLSCGAPLGYDQPGTCKRCGFVVNRSEAYCPNCRAPL